VAAAPPNERASAPEPRARALLVEELERRIATLEAAEESEIGSFTAWDWVACIVGAFLVPAFALWWFAP